MPLRMESPYSPVPASVWGRYGNSGHNTRVGFPTTAGFKVASHSFYPTVRFLHWVPEANQPGFAIPTCAQAQAVGKDGYAHV